MTLTVVTPNCQLDNPLVAKIRLIVENLNPSRFSVIVDGPDNFGIETIMIDDGTTHLEISIICKTGRVELLHQRYSKSNRLVDVSFQNVTHYMQVIQALLPVFPWKKIEGLADNFLSSPSVESLEMFALVAIAKLV